MKHALGCLFWRVAGIALLSAAALSQTAVDAREVDRNRSRNPSAGYFGTIGRKLPLEVRLIIGGNLPNDGGNTDVEFTLENTGNQDISIPVSPNPGDLESSGPEVGYSLANFQLYVSSKRGEKPEVALPGGAELYGNQELAGSLVILRPGESIRVLARVVFPPILSSDEPTGQVFVAHASLSNQAIKLIFENAEEVGVASSRSYPAQALFNFSE